MKRLVCVATRVFLSDLGQSVLFVQRTGGVHFTLHGLIQTQLLLKTTVDPETYNHLNFTLIPLSFTS